MKNTGLGKGLSALINNQSLPQSSQGYIPNLDIDLISPNPYQPRMEIKDDTLNELAASIKEHGIIEPLLVTQTGENKYDLIAGERRLRATKLAGLTTVPVVVKESSPQEMLELAVLENVQRADLNPLEEAMAYEQLVKEFGMTHEQISKRMGVSRPAIANKIRLLALPEELRRGLLELKISEGHARAILGLTSQENILLAYKTVLRDHLSVRAVEELVRRLNKGKIKIKAKTRLMDDRTVEVENFLKTKFGEKALVTRSIKGGKIVLPFANDSELDSIMGKLS